MYKLKVGILEDNKDQLKDRKFDLEETGLVDVIIWALNSQEFFEKADSVQLDAIILDIDLGNDSATGLDVAYKLKMPTLFVSGHNPKHLLDIEKLEREFDVVVAHITKPFTESEFKKSAIKFINEVRSSKESEFILLDFQNTKQNKIPIDSIVCLCSDKAAGSESNNKQIYFTDRKPEILIDFSFKKMHEFGFNRNKFLTIHRSFVVNEKHIKIPKKQVPKIEVTVMNSDGKMVQKELSVSEIYRFK